MSLKEKTFQIEDVDGTLVEITVRRANAVRGVQRYELMLDADEKNKTEPVAALKPLRFFSYPDCIAGTVSAGFKEWPLPFDYFVELDEEAVNTWVDAVHEVNPHWGATALTVEDKEKKEPS